MSSRIMLPELARCSPGIRLPGSMPACFPSTRAHELEQQLRDGSLVDVFPDYEVTATSYDIAAWLLYPSRDYLPLKVRVFVDFLKRKFREGPPWETAVL